MTMTHWGWVLCCVLQDKANNGDTAAFVRLTEAYEVLSSPPRRRTYDKYVGSAWAAVHTMCSAR